MKSNKYLTIGLLTGFIVGGCIGVLAWAFLQNLFAISICAGIGMLIGIVIPLRCGYFLVFDFGAIFSASINKAILNSHIVTHSFTIRH